MSDRPPTSRRRIARWRYVVPNAITCVGLLIGLTATFRAMEGDHLEAGWLIILCVLLDKLDGTAARLLKSTSAIGVQLDSFSDFVTFGIAPATLVFTAIWRGVEGAPDEAFVMWHGAVAGWVLRALVASYVLCAVIRLAKFNVLTESGRGDVFYGFPTTASGALMALVFIIAFEHGMWETMRWLPILAASTGALMVSDLPLPKFGLRKSRMGNGIQAVGITVAYVFGVARIYPEVLLGLLVSFAIPGFLWGFMHRHDLGSPRLDPYPQ